MSQAVRAGHGDRRPGRGSCDKEAPALTGLRPEIRTRSCRWMTLSYSTRLGGWGVALPGAGVGPGEQDGSRVRVRTGTEAHTGTVVGILDRKAARQRHVRQPPHLTLSDLCHHIIYNRGGRVRRERVRKREHMRAREADRGR